MSTVHRRQHGQHFAVTGAGSGIGRAIALRLAAEGAAVSLLGRRAEPLDETARLIQGEGGSAIVATADIRQQASIADNKDAVTVGRADRLDHPAGGWQRKGDRAQLLGPGEDTQELRLGHA